MAAKGIVITVITALVAMGAAAGAAEDDFLGSLPDHLTPTASNRIRGEFVSWFDPTGPNSNNAYNFFANRLRFGATLNYPELEVVVEAQDTAMVNLPGADSSNPQVGPLGPGGVYFANNHARDENALFLHLGYATVRQFGLPGTSVRVGRFGYNQGLEKVAQDPSLAWLQRARISQRLIGNFDYTNVGRSFDGVQALYDNGPFNFTAMASHPTFGGYNVSGNREIGKVDLVSATASLVEPKDWAPTSAQIFYIYYADRRGLVATDNRQRDLPKGQTCATNNNGTLIRSCDTSNIYISTVGTDVVHIEDIGPGRLDLLGWFAGQVGSWQSLDQDAWAFATEVGYQLPNVPLKPWLRLNYFMSSGDSNNTDYTHQTFFQVLPTARTYAFFPFFNMMNNQDFFVQGILKLLPNLTAAATGHWLRLTESNDLLYSGGGATSNTFFGYAGIPTNGVVTHPSNELSYLTDIELTYVFNKHLTLYGYYGHAFGQSVISTNFLGNNADYGYIEATLTL